MKFRAGGMLGVVAALAVAGATGTANAGGADAGSVTMRLFGGDFSYNGQVRVETAFSTTGRASPANQRGLLTNGLAVNRAAGNPATQYNTTIDSGAGPTLQESLDAISALAMLPAPIVAPTGLPPTKGVSNLSPSGTSDTFTRYVKEAEQVMNYHIVRLEVAPSINWGDWSLQMRFRGIYDPGSLGYEDFDFSDYDDINGGFETGFRDAGRQYRGKPDYMGYEVDGKKNPIFFERSGKHYSLDAPAFFVQWTNGDVTARVGNQSVAWGQLLFFRIMDQANGLDLRRHLFIDRAIEEFADERMSAPGLRITWQATDNILIDTFAQQFIPTIVPNSNTTYNIVDSRFILHDNYFDGGYNEELNYGIRIKGEYGNFNLQAMATSKLNHLGSIRWTKSNINKALPNSNTLGVAFNQYCEQVLNAGNPDAAGQGCGPQLALTPFESGPAGLFTAEEWFDRAGYTKLDPLDGLGSIVEEFQPTTGQLLTAVPTTAQQAYNELNAFFIALEGAHGHVERDYYREEVYGLGGGYVVDAEPGSLLDQLIINLEATYTPERTFTNIGLRQAYDKRDEVQIGLVMEKYQRFSQNRPATYMVFQYLWQKESSLEGLLLDGYGSSAYSDSALQGRKIQLTNNVPVSDNPNQTFHPGIDAGANYVVLAALQPSNAYIFEYSIATLIDLQGGVLVQPAVQWKPQGNMTVNLFYNFIDAEVWGGNANNSFLSFVDFADELCLRLGYQF